jgi:drug/metabolite transporter (DMT)-like permease
MNQPFRSAHLGALFALVTFWSLAFVMLKITVASIPPATAALSRLAIAALILWLIMRLMGNQLSLKWEHWRYYLLLGFVANTLPFLLVLHGMQHIESGIGAILMGAMPVGTVILAHFFTDSAEQLTPRKWIGVLIGFAAIILLIGPSALSGLGHHVFAELSVVGGALCFAVAAVVTRRAPGLPISTLSAGVMVAAVITALPITMLFDWPFDIVPTTQAYLAVVWLGVFPTGLATLLYFFVVLQAGTGFFAMSNYLVPVAGFFWGMLFLSETPSWQSLLALSMILLGIWLVGPAKAKR